MDINATLIAEVYRYVLAGASWDDIHDGAGTGGFVFDDPVYNMTAGHIHASSTTNLFRRIRRNIIAFDLSSETRQISSATIKLKCVSFAGDGNFTDFKISLCQASVGDGYQDLGSIDFGSANPDEFISDEYTFISLNQAGIAYLNSNLGATCAFGIREGTYDLPDIEPSWGSGLQEYALLYGTDFPPILSYSPSIARTNTIKDLTPLQALRNLEMSAKGRFYIDNEGKARWESRYTRITL